ncbi:MAG: DUF1699 family protein [Methanothrix sp.]
MRLRVVCSKNELQNLSPNDEMIHVAFRASNVDYLSLLQKCPRLKMIQLPHSYYKTMPIAIRMFLDVQGIEMLSGDLCGHRKDLDEYFIVDDAIIEEIIALADSGMSLEDIANQAPKTARIGPDLIKYIAKNKITA